MRRRKRRGRGSGCEREGEGGYERSERGRGGEGLLGRRRDRRTERDIEAETFHVQRIRTWRRPARYALLRQMPISLVMLICLWWIHVTERQVINCS